MTLGLQPPPPEARIDSDDLAKNTGEMGLVAHSAVESDLRKRLPGVQHDALGVAHPPYFDIGEWSLTEALSEGAREVADAQLHDAGEVRNTETEANMRIDVGGHTLRLPGSEATPRGILTPQMPRSFQAEPQKLLRLLHAGFRPIPVAVERGGCRGQEADQRFVAGTAG